MTAVLSSISVLMFVAVFITRVRHDYWMFRILEYPRLQKLSIVAVLVVCWLFLFPLNDYVHYVSFSLLLAAGLYLLYKVHPYTPFCRKEMKSSSGVQGNDQLRIFTANVYQDNRQYAKLMRQIEQEDPDVIFLVETDRAWSEAASSLKKKYPYTLEQPQENTYGLLLFSRLPLTDGQVNFLVKDDIPSVQAKIRLSGEQEILLFGLHPEPPVPGENLYATAKDKELMKVALKVRECKCPCIVFGDLNDVAWSHTTELFRKTSRLLDPRIGRGFYSTFSAHHPFLRFPLDYIFCSDHFQLARMKRMPKNGSDHFATSVTLVFVPEEKNLQEAPTADHEEVEEAKSKARQELPEGE
jgi:endonuclease/exonuclease/phosphatase (EEP) superfamily protein YafD